MTSNVIHFPRPLAAPAALPRVTIHCNRDGAAAVVIRPSPPGVAQRREFASYDEAWPHADEMARTHAAYRLKDGSGWHTVIVAGPEEDA